MGDGFDAFERWGPVIEHDGSADCPACFHGVPTVAWRFVGDDGWMGGSTDGLVWSNVAEYRLPPYALTPS